MIEPFTVASSFATIVGLISNFLSENRHAENIDINEFLSWISQHGFDEVRTLIETNQQTTISIKALLTERSDVILERFCKLDSVLASIASEVKGVKELAVAILPNASISEQAINLIRQLEEQQASGFFELKIMGGHNILHSYEGGQLDYEDQRFIEDDLNTLVELGFLRLGRTPKGENQYGFTRAASEYVKLLENSSNN